MLELTKEDYEDLVDGIGRAYENAYKTAHPETSAVQADPVPVDVNVNVDLSSDFMVLLFLMFVLGCLVGMLLGMMNKE